MTERYRVEEEITKDARKRLIQYAIHDTLTGGVVARYALRDKAEIICDQMNERYQNG